MIRSLLFLLFLKSAFTGSTVAQSRTDSLLANLFTGVANPVFNSVINNPQKYRLQIIYTQIDRDRQNKPTFTNHYFNYNPDLYFNPASTVKLPIAILALEKLNRLNRKDINKFTTIQFDSSYQRQSTAYTDSTSETGLPTIANYIRKVFLISDNDAYNRLYQFLGQQYIHRRLKELGYATLKIPRMFSGFTSEQNRHTNQVRFLSKEGKTIYTQAAAHNTDSFDFSRTIKLGKAYMNSRDSIINEPFDFTLHNNLTLEDLRKMLQTVLFPQSVQASGRFHLIGEDYTFLRQFLSQYPSETNYPLYDTSKFYNSYVKFFFRDSTRIMPQHVRVFNKVGWSYGFLTDVSYVADFKYNIEYMLAATIYVNEDEILNDNKYEYESIGHPFLRTLGGTIHQYELTRKRKHKPNLTAFKLNYDKRDGRNDKVITEADN